MRTTLQILDSQLETNQDSNHRSHLGASLIGSDCPRQVWYGFRWSKSPSFNSSTLRRFRDGHASEELIADELSKVVELMGRQARFQDGHFGGSIDGIIRSGLVEAPDVPHIWEHKCIGEEKFKALQRKEAKELESYGHTDFLLQKWHRKYFEQAQVYMLKIGIDWHFMTVASAGSRDLLSMRTELDVTFAETVCDKAQHIIESREAPAKVSEYVDTFACRFCDFAGLCHGNEDPSQNCRTCRYSSALRDGLWRCDYDHSNLSEDKQRAGCAHYARFLDH